MISQAKIDANKRNAAKSTGPRTPEGKDKVRFNAVTHGLTAATVVLPHEDEQAYQHRLEAWTRDLQPPDEPGRYLVERAVRISWQLDRADTAEQARLTSRIQDAHRLFADGGAEPAEILFARLLGTVEAQPAQSLGSRRGGSAPVNSPALLLIALESSAEGCRLLMHEWTRILDWLGPLGPEGIASPGVTSRRDYIKRAMQLLGVRYTEPGDPPVTTTDPVTAPFVRALRALNDQAMLGFLDEDDDDDDDSPGRVERDFELEKPYWESVGLELLTLASERRARLKTMLARHQENQVEARPGLAAEASFDDTAEGERLHRYQERWHRSLLRTLAKIEELRDRGPLDDQEMEEAFVGQDSHPVIPFMIEETRWEPCPTTEERDVNEAPVKGTEPGQDGVAAGGQSIRQQEKCQNKPTAERSTEVGQGPRAQKRVESNARSALRTNGESHDPGSASRPVASEEENARSDSHANSTVATRPWPGGGGPAPDRHRGQLRSGWLDSPPGRI